MVSIYDELIEKRNSIVASCGGVSTAQFATIIPSFPPLIKFSGVKWHRKWKRFL
jgi:hypothetical protein